MLCRKRSLASKISEPVKSGIIGDCEEDIVRFDNCMNRLGFRMQKCKTHNGGVDDGLWQVQLALAAFMQARLEMAHMD